MQETIGHPTLTSFELNEVLFQHYKSSRIQDEQRQERAVHESLRQYQSDFCTRSPAEDRTFFRRDNLSQHLHLVHKVDRSLNLLPSWLDHWRSDVVLSPDDPALRCPYCNFVGPTWALRTAHIEAEHFRRLRPQRRKQKASASTVACEQAVSTHPRPTSYPTHCIFCPHKFWQIMWSEQQLKSHLSERHHVEVVC